MEAREATATGESCMRVDAIAKVTGRARYTALLQIVGGDKLIIPFC